MRNIQLLIAYLGTSFKGWQKSSLGPTIESELEKALQRLLGTLPSLQAASRTDAGVHAQGQVVNFFTSHSSPSYNLLKGLNALLPPPIRVLEVVEKPPSFHPTLDSLGKEYHYHVTTAPVQLPFYRLTHWHYPHPLDLNLLLQAATPLLGTHDFTAFTNASKHPRASPLCTLEEISLLSLPDHNLRLIIKGDRFLYKMVRNLAGTLLYIASNRLPPETIPSLLLQKDRREAGMTAPAHGLTLQKVFYKLVP